MDRIEQLKIFLKNNPDDCFLNHALALENIKVGKLEEGKTIFVKNLQHDVKYLATYYHLGKAYEALKENDEAMAIYEQGMKVAKEANDMHTYNELQAAYEDLAY